MDADRKPSDAVEPGPEGSLEQPHADPPAAAPIAPAPGGPRRWGSRLSVRAADEIIAGIARAAGIEDAVTPHVLRHTFATPSSRLWSPVTLRDYSRF